MPLFFCVSGFLFKRSKNLADLKAMAKSKTLRLFVPYLTTGTLLFICRGHWGYWFLLSLFELLVYFSIVTFTLSRLLKKEGFIADVLIVITGFFIVKVFSVLVLSEIPVWGDIDIVKFNIYYLPFCLGYMWKKNEKIRIILESNGVYLVSLIIFGTIFYIRYKGHNSFFADHMKSIMSLCACICVFQLFLKKKRPFVIAKILSSLGQHSLQIYICHVFFVCQFAQIGACVSNMSLVNSFFMQVLYSLIVSAVAIVLSLVCSNILCHSNLLSSILFGSKYIKQ